MSARAAETILVLSSLPDADAARALASSLVGQHLAACVTMLPAARSLFRWQGQIEEAEEVVVLIKSTRPRYPELEEAIRALHPYELPEILMVSVEQGLPDYLAWVANQTRSPA